MSKRCIALSFSASLMIRYYSRFSNNRSRSDCRSHSVLVESDMATATTASFTQHRAWVGMEDVLARREQASGIFVLLFDSRLRVHIVQLDRPCCTCMPSTAFSRYGTNLAGFSVAGKCPSCSIFSNRAPLILSAVALDISGVVL